MLVQIIDLENGRVLAAIPSEDESSNTEIIARSDLQLRRLTRSQTTYCIDELATARFGRRWPKMSFDPRRTDADVAGRR